MMMTTSEKEKFTVMQITGEQDAKPEEIMISFKRMCDQMDSVLRMNRNFILFDLSDCSYINSSIISLFVVAATKVREKGGWIKLIVPSENTRQILELVGIDKIAQIFKTKEESPYK